LDKGRPFAVLAPQAPPACRRTFVQTPQARSGPFLLSAFPIFALPCGYVKEHRAGPSPDARNLPAFPLFPMLPAENRQSSNGRFTLVASRPLLPVGGFIHIFFGRINPD
jgi:hypothetical protein